MTYRRAAASTTPYIPVDVGLTGFDREPDRTGPAAGWPSSLDRGERNAEALPEERR